MADTKTLPQTLTKPVIEKLIDACERFYPTKLMGDGYAGYQTRSYQIPEANLSWNNSLDFLNYVTNITGTENIKSAYQTLTDWWTTAPEQTTATETPQEGETTVTETPTEGENITTEAPEVGATTLSTEQLETLQEERAAREEKRKETVERSQRQTREGIERLQKAQAEKERLSQKETYIKEFTAEEKQEIKNAIKDKVVYIEPKNPAQKQEIKLAPEEKEGLEKLKKSAKLSPETFTEKLATKIIQNDPGMGNEAAKVVAADVAKRLAFEEPVAPSVVFAAIATSPQTIQQVTGSRVATDSLQQAAASNAFVFGVSQEKLREILYPIIGKNVTEEIYYSFSAQEHIVTANPTPNTTYTVGLKQLNDGFENFSQTPIFRDSTSPAVDLTKDFVRDRVKEEVSGVAKKIGASFLEKLPKNGPFSFISKIRSSNLIEQGLFSLKVFQTEYVATTPLGNALSLAFPRLQPLFSSLNGLFGINTGIAPVVASTAEAGSVAIGTVTSEAITTGTTTLATAAGTAEATTITTATVAGQAAIPVPGVGAVIGAVVGVVLGWLGAKAVPAIKKWLSGNKEIIIALSAGAVAMIAGVGILPALAVGGLFFVGSSFLVGGAVGARMVIGTIFRIPFYILSKLILPVMSTSLIVTLIGVPLAVALILFIINSGAYVVPGTGGLSGGGNGEVPEECRDDTGEKPEAEGVRYGNYNGRTYAFPVAPYNQTYHTCAHWDGTNATDIGIAGFERGAHLPVVAYTSGVVSSTSLNDSKGGKYIILKGDDGRYYYYAHNCALYVQTGQRVNAGDVMATTDNTGSAARTVEHLHFAISNYPSFYSGGTIMPGEDFEEKFQLGKCRY